MLYLEASGKPRVVLPKTRVADLVRLVNNVPWRWDGGTNYGRMTNALQKYMLLCFNVQRIFTWLFSSLSSGFKADRWPTAPRVLTLSKEFVMNACMYNYFIQFD